MDKRLKLHETLCGIIGITEPNGDRHTYLQTPELNNIKYPAIVYELDSIDVKSANNRPYTIKPGYKLTLIDKNPDSEYVNKLIQLPGCSFVTHYKSDNLNHFVFKIY